MVALVKLNLHDAIDLALDRIFQRDNRSVVLF
jgi:hypothetical protein